MVSVSGSHRPALISASVQPAPVYSTISPSIKAPVTLTVNHSLMAATTSNSMPRTRCLPALMLRLPWLTPSVTSVVAICMSVTSMLNRLMLPRARSPQKSPLAPISKFSAYSGRNENSSNVSGSELEPVSNPPALNAWAQRAYSDSLSVGR